MADSKRIGGIKQLTKLVKSLSIEAEDDLPSSDISDINQQRADSCETTRPQTSDSKQPQADSRESSVHSSVIVPGYSTTARGLSACAHNAMTRGCHADSLRQADLIGEDGDTSHILEVYGFSMSTKSYLIAQALGPTVQTIVMVDGSHALAVFQNATAG